MGGTPGLVVRGWDSCSEGRGFESQQRILDGRFCKTSLRYDLPLLVNMDVMTENSWFGGMRGTPFAWIKLVIDFFWGANTNNKPLPLSLSSFEISFNVFLFDAVFFFQKNERRSTLNLAEIDIRRYTGTLFLEYGPNSTSYYLFSCRWCDWIGIRTRDRRMVSAAESIEKWGPLPTALLLQLRCNKIQCEQIGRFFKVLSNKVSKRSSPNIWWMFWAI